MAGQDAGNLVVYLYEEFGIEATNAGFSPPARRGYRLNHSRFDCRRIERNVSLIGSSVGQDDLRQRPKHVDHPEIDIRGTLTRIDRRGYKVVQDTQAV